MTRHSLVVIAALLAGATTAPPTPAQTQGGNTLTAPYNSLDRIEDDWVNRNPVPTRPMLIMPDGVTLWAVNPYLSQVVKIQNFQVAAASTFRTLPGPVAIATYTPSGGTARLLVVCQHVNAVAVHDAATGDLLNVIPVREQPADIVVDAANHAVVSCPGADAVVDIDLTSPTFAQTTYSVPGRSPTFLSLLPVAETPGEVLVAPRISGNGSLVDRKTVTDNNASTLTFNEHAGTRGIIDTLDVDVCDDGFGLPDHDLYWIDRTGPNTGARPIAKSMGTILLANTIRPTTSTLWQLNLDANNKDETLQTEGSIKGKIVTNRLTRFAIPTLNDSVAPTAPTLTIRNLNSSLASTTDAVGTPYSLAFNSSGSLCFVVGLLTDNVIALDSGGNRVGGVTHLGDGAMPRQVLSNAAGTIAFIWGMMDRDANSATKGDFNCAVYALPISTGVATPIDIGFDPTPPTIQFGRQLFFDASHSEFNDSSCASCHDEGKTDMLAWNLSNIDPHDVPDATDDDGADNKGPMVTQTLVGIRTALPFHWRGEQMRGLLDFNAAFAGLLGDLNDPPGLNTEAGSEFDAFEAFILSLTEDANRAQHKNRILDDGIDPPGPDGTPMITSAVLGQDSFASVGCISCHTLPKGSNNEVVNNTFSGEDLPKRLWLKVAPYQGLQFKGFQQNVSVTFDASTSPHRPTELTQLYPAVGTGLAHAGVVGHLREFVLAMVGEVPGTADDQTRANLTAFLHQFDTGIAPAAHAWKFINSGNAATLPAAVNYLINQAAPAKRNCDIAVIGRTAPAAPFTGWAYDRATGLFVSENNVAPQSVATFKTQAQGGGWFAFVGLPPGTARRFAIDFDGDQLLNGFEAASGVFDQDTDDDTFWDGAGLVGAPQTVPVYPDVDGERLKFQWSTEKVARLTFETNELTTATLWLDSPGLDRIEVIESLPKMQHNLVVDEMLPARTYTITLTIADLPTPSTPSTPVDVHVENLISKPRHDADINVDSHIVEELDWDGPPVQDLNGNRSFSASGKVVQRLTVPSVPIQNAFVVARVLINDKPAQIGQFHSVPFDHPFIVAEDASGMGNNTFVLTKLYTAIPPPFVLSAPTPADGSFTLSFSLTPLGPTDTVKISIEAVGPFADFIPGTPEPDWVPVDEPPLNPGDDYLAPVMQGRAVGDRFWAIAGLAEFTASFWSFPDTLDNTSLLTWP